MINKTTITLLLVMLQLSVYAQQTYRLDLKKSKILWKAKTMGSHYGYILFKEGSLTYSPDDLPKEGTFSINMNSMNSTDQASANDNQRVNKELRSADFFNVPKYPLSTMVVKQMVRIGNSTHFKITGALTIKEMTNTIVFTANIMKKEDSLNITAELKIDRIKWNINHQADKPWNFFSTVKDKITSDEIQISLDLVLNK
ncbi:YceI family protein [Pedobacter sp. ASV28]|uniref:YceI family protein n=1 Tax=Pedobacter sp. ASV28 TaxID=2795123 RepID=UPI0018EDE122|nr:YceI family protein [Pedobacter sp. ASV28]